MIRQLFQKFFGWPCDHVWETLVSCGERTITYDDTDQKTVKHFGVYRCTKCCKGKQVRT